jgi:hypothetical protein
MIPSPDFRLDISITIAEEVIKMGCATIGFAIAVWGAAKIISIIAKANEKSNSEVSRTS